MIRTISVGPDGHALRQRPAHTRPVPAAARQFDSHRNACRVNQPAVEPLKKLGILIVTFAGQAWLEEHVEIWRDWEVEGLGGGTR